MVRRWRESDHPHRMWQRSAVAELNLMIVCVKELKDPLKLKETI